MDKIQDKFSIYQKVPWFSWEEWRYVYKNIFSNKSEDWKKAYSQISVWKARIPKLAVGIESTIPLLHAQIAQLDPQMEDSFKVSILNMAIVRFVSTVTKGYEERYMVGKPMQSLASRMNLPPYLIDLRHQIIHSDSVFGTSQTLKAALETSLEWIKIHYWEEEEKKSKIQAREATELHTMNRSEEGSERPDEYGKTGTLSFSKMKLIINEYLTKVITLLKTSPKGKNRSFLMNLQGQNSLRLETERCLSIDAGETLKFIVRELFYSPLLEEEVQRKELSQEKNKCPCKCILPKSFTSRTSFVLKLMISNQLINPFIKELIKQGNGHDLLCRLWLEAIIGSVIPELTKLCRNHQFNQEDTGNLRSAIKWKHLLFHLLSFGSQWSTELALKLSEHEVAIMDPSSRKILKQASDIYLGVNSEAKDCTMSKEVDVSSEVLTLHGILHEAKKTSDKVLEYAEDVCARVKDTPVETVKRNHSEEFGSFIGVLPHQEGDPYFFLQLVLNPTESPPKKRPKTSRESSQHSSARA